MSGNAVETFTLVACERFHASAFAGIGFEGSHIERGDGGRYSGPSPSPNGTPGQRIVVVRRGP